MENNDNRRRFRRPPTGYSLLLVLMALPLLGWPALMGLDFGDNQSDSLSTLCMVFPVYALLSLYLAYRVYDARREVSIILVVLLLLSYAALGWMVASAF